MVVLLMLASTVAVSTIISNQNQRSSNDLLSKLLNVVRDSLTTQQEKVLEDSIQISTINSMGARLSLIYSYKEKSDDNTMAVTTNTYREIVKDLFQIGQAGGMDKVDKVD